MPVADNPDNVAVLASCKVAVVVGTTVKVEVLAAGVADVDFHLGGLRLVTA